MSLTISHIYFLAIGAICTLLVLFGLVGPKAVRAFFQRVNTWLFRDSQILFPVDPYKPLTNALKSVIKPSHQLRRRVRNLLYTIGVLIAASILFALVSFAIVTIHAN